ncbi:MAG: aminotransferase class V-fold PLP-dependent enzyme [Anaerolineae bacterium]|nr:aminotransferase class V-fold PLP-dependent enzyme [Anaerolineae bacterium]
MRQQLFHQKYPTYKSTTALDDLRAADFSRLDHHGHVYLDYTGGGLYGESQVRAHQRLLLEGVFGNPHSSNPSSLAATRLVEAARECTLAFFNASPDEYVAIFTQNATGALKLIGESYPFGQGCRYLLTFDNHNSVNGIREYARARGAEITYIPLRLPDMHVDENALRDELSSADPGCNNLFAYPAQSNFSSVQHPLEWIDLAHQAGWQVVLDAAAFAPTNRLDLSLVKPDFVPVSFYKIFGYPTGLGALIARREALAKMQRPWFAGGTITVASVQGGKHYLAEAPAAFEDGTIDYLDIPAVTIGLDYIQTVSIEIIHERVRCLTGWLLDNLSELKHGSGVPLVRIYGPLTTKQRGGAVTVNFYDHEGFPIDHRTIEQAANQHNISLRTGCFCNPGAGELALGISQPELAACFSAPEHSQRLSYDDFRRCIDGKASGAVRISVGMVSNFTDVEKLLNFANDLLHQG